jgi:hypothetical protein
MDHSNKACNASGGTKSISDNLSVSLRAWNHFVHNTETAGHFVQKLIVQEPGGYVRVAAMVCVISYGEGLARGCLEMCRTTVHHQLGTLPINHPPLKHQTCPRQIAINPRLTHVPKGCQ